MRCGPLAVLLFAAASVYAQVNESITVQYVEVPVTVVDRGGNPIRGLTKANFEVFDDGRKREIGGFELVDFASLDVSATAAATTRPISPAARRNFLLLFDLTFSTPASMTRAKAAAREFATKMMTRDDRIAVATVDVAHGFRILASFTTDRSVVAQAIANPQGFTAFDPLQLAGRQVDKDVAQSMMEGNPYAKDQNENVIRAINLQEDQYNRSKINDHVALLSGLAAALRGVRGQKHVVLLSEGFDPELIQGHDDLKKTEAKLRGELQGTRSDSVNAAAESGEIWKVDTESRFGSSSGQGLVQALGEIAKRSDVTLDAVDTAGVRSGLDAREGVQSSSNEGLHMLTAATGGTVFQNTNDLADDFRRALKAQDVIYVLGFQAPSKQPWKFHHLKVRLVDVPGGHATARSGYYEGGVAATSAERSLGNAEIIVNDVAQSGVRLASVAAPYAGEGPNAAVAVTVEIEGKDVSLPNGGSPTIEVYTYAFDAQGDVRASNVHRISVDAAKVGAKLLRRGVKYYETLSLPPGSYAVKTLVRVAESDKKGFARTDVVVPENGALPAAPPVVADQDWLMVKDDVVRRQ
ncbi:MAG TPA: VWA domain-containing protein [Thermoanaerobaculia bacterium]|nr:VWA domain-containing protein [Thermoanaerobaculia bacterium]